MFRNAVVSIACLLLITVVRGQTVPEKTGSKISCADAQALLDHHNKVREDVGSPPLEWSAELAEFAQEWADYLAATGCSMKHRPKEGKWKQKYGENIFWGGSSAYFTPLDASKSWYSEIKAYHNEAISHDNYKKFGHYTQMVWKSTTHVGVGVAICRNGAILVVANYYPPGNYIGQKPY